MAIMVSTDEQVRQRVLRELKPDARLQRNEIGLVHSWTRVASVEDRIVVSLSRV